MGKMQILYSCCFFLIVGSQLALGQFLECGDFEVEVECIECLDDLCTIEIPCTPRCDCWPGFERDISGICIPCRTPRPTPFPPRRPTTRPRRPTTPPRRPTTPPRRPTTPPRRPTIPPRRPTIPPRRPTTPPRRPTTPPCPTAPQPCRATPPPRRQDKIRYPIKSRNLGDLSGSGCPNRQLCLEFCRRRHFTNAICLGPDRQFCNCFSFLS
ncbi:hypothetical protein CDAR_80871 [Caerostris darwini]|uniref:Uncharacterized protein n=1 Tax=Caerostris darwini TaxID=1538125 RepID=A0AAV4SCK3_9ARAC|nr:hypothetical protein CDAR_80781 [Caerostris darwini]GIY31207.1 hypothetical protein CDAR_80871 [Caerostris darwini]